MATSLVARPRSDEDLMNQVYNDLKQVETIFPIPAFPATIDMGTFDAATGEFDGLTTETVPGPKPALQTIHPEVDVNAARVDLRFNIQNQQGTIMITVNGRNTIVPRTQNAAIVSTGFASSVQWSIRSGAKEYSDTLKINRPRVIGAGAFTVPILPMAVLYEPPQEQGVQAVSSYSRTTFLGSTVSMSFQHETSTTSAEFDALGDFADQLGQLATAIGSATDADSIGAVVQGIRFIAAASESDSTSLTSSNRVTSDHKLDLVNTFTETYTTTERLGPGAGDVIIFLRNARLAWLFDRGNLRLALLGADERSAYSVKVLQQDIRIIDATPSYSAGIANARELLLLTPQPVVGLVTGLDRDSLVALLSLDPFVAGGPHTPLSAARFKLSEVFSGGGVASAYTFESRVEQSDERASVDVFTKTEDDKPGWLSLFGIGPQSHDTVVTTITHESSAAERSGQIINETVTFTPEGDAPFRVAAYYDRVFGTYAFEEPTGLTVVATGIAKDANDRPLIKQLVTMKANGKKLTAESDKYGYYTILSTALASGRGMLRMGGTSREVILDGTPLHDIELRTEVVAPPKRPARPARPARAVAS